MIALELTDIKDSMAKLLFQNTFDNFLFIEGEITTYNKFTLDGYLQKKFYDEETNLLIGQREYTYWKDMKDLCFSMIKGKRTPLDFHFVYGLSAGNIGKLLSTEGIPLKPEDVGGLFLNFKYDGEHLGCITGTSIKTFTLDKSLEHAWDNMVQRFLTKSEIHFKVL